jgi:general secretion pathway protein K
MKAEHGFALILVIWSLVMMTSLATGFAMAVRHETRVAQDAVAGLEADAAMTAALNYALHALNLRDREARWLADGRVHVIPWGDATVTVQIRSESGKADINRAPREVLEGLIGQSLPDAPAAEMVDALIDWRDRDERPLPQGAERDDYLAAGYSYGPANAPFESVHELSQVMGFDGERMSALLPYITVYSRRPRINAMSADLLTLIAVPGVSPLDAEQFITQRDDAITEDRSPPTGLLKSGKRYLDMHLDNKVITMDIEVRLKDTPPRAEQVILQLGADRYYEVLAREPSVASGKSDEQAL